MATKDDLIIQRLDDLKDSTNQRLDSIDTNLAEHMRRTDVLEKLHGDNQKRIALLEEPKMVLKYIRNGAYFISAVAAAVLTLLKLTGKL